MGTIKSTNQKKYQSKKFHEKVPRKSTMKKVP